MKAPNLEKAERALEELYSNGISLLEEYPWEWESDRWHEFLCCTMISAFGDGSRVRAALATVRELDLSSPEALAGASPADLLLLRDILVRYDYPEEEAEQAAQLLVAIGTMAQRTWGGNIQRVLRQWGQKIRDDLAGCMSRYGVPVAVGKKAAVLWLQNVANIPLLDTSDEHIKEFCARHSLTPRDLTNIADRAGANLSVLDDLLALDSAAREQQSPPSKAGKRLAKDD